MEWINDKVAPAEHRELHSTPCDKLMEKNTQQKNIQMYVQLLHLPVQQKGTQLWKSTPLQEDRCFKKRMMAKQKKRSICPWSTIYVRHVHFLTQSQGWAGSPGFMPQVH